MRRNKKYWFWRSVLICSVFFGCVLFGIAGVFKAYEGITKTAYAEQQPAIEQKNGEIIFLGQRFSFKIGLNK